MIARSTKIQLLVFLLLSLAGMSYAGIKYAGLGKYFVDQGYVVSADFVDSGGIFKGAEVTYRGVPAGKVEQLELVPNGVRVSMRLDNGTQVPDDARAIVGNRSAVGEQYVDLQPQRAEGPYLRDGSVIPVERTDIPISPTELVTNLDDMVQSIDTADLGVVLDELGRAFDGAGDSLQRLVDSGDVLTRAAIENLPQTKALLRDGKTALDTQREVAGQFRSFNADLALLTETLRSSDPDFRTLYENGTAGAVELTDLIERNRTALPMLLDNLVTVAQVQKVRIPALRQMLVTYPNAVAGGFTVAPGDGTSHFGMVMSQEAPVCEYDTPTRSPQDTTIRPDMDAYCAAPAGSGTTVRGAHNAPRPNNLPPYPHDRADSGTAAAGSRTPTIDEPAAIGDYDPISGRVITQDGYRFTLGSTAGAADRFGGDSWKWLMLNPLSS